MIKNESIELLKSRLDIVDVVGNYVELKKAGSSYKGLCPFHGEKTPSFNVSPAKQFYHCFGCGAGGDAIRFVMEYEKLSYPEAIEKLARDYNFTLEYEAGKEKPKTKVLEQLGEYFKSRLESNREAMRYLEERGLHHATIEKFEIGYAPATGEQMAFFRSRYLSHEEGMETGVLVHSDDGRTYPRFTQRITFPIYAPGGLLVGFGGRTLGNHPAKYINSPQTKLFNKSRILYAYPLARDAIYKQQRVIVTEGYMDTIMLHQAGFPNTVATLGTALTREHLPLLRKGEPKIVVAYDGDNAGKAAALKAAQLLLSHGFKGGVVLFSDGLDPADMVKRGNIKLLDDLFSSPIDFGLFSIDAIIEQHHGDKDNAFKELRTFLDTIQSIERNNYLDYAAGKLKISSSYFKLTALPSSQARGVRDLAELSIIKTILAKPELTDSLLDIIPVEAFNYHRDILETVVNGSPENVQWLLVDDEAKIFSPEELHTGLLKLLAIYYERKRQEIHSDPTIKGTQKSFLIKKYRDAILSLRKGKVVVVNEH